MPIASGPVLADEVVEGFFQVVAAAEDRARLAEVGRGDIDGLLEMADHVTADVGRAALGAVDQGDAALDAPEGDARPQGRAELARVPRRDERRPALSSGVQLFCLFSSCTSPHFGSNVHASLPGRGELPDRAHDRRVDLPAEIEHALKTCEGYLALVVVIAKADAHLVCDGPLLYPADEEIHALLHDEARQLQGVRIVHDDRALVADLLRGTRNPPGFPSGSRRRRFVCRGGAGP